MHVFDFQKFFRLVHTPNSSLIAATLTKDFILVHCMSGERTYWLEKNGLLANVLICFIVNRNLHIMMLSSSTEMADSKCLFLGICNVKLSYDVGTIAKCAPDCLFLCTNVTRSDYYFCQRHVLEVLRAVYRFYVTGSIHSWSLTYIFGGTADSKSTKLTSHSSPITVEFPVQ